VVRAPEGGSQGSLQGLSAPQRIFPDPLPKFYSKHSALTVFFRPQVSKLSLPMIEEARRADGAVAVLTAFVIRRACFRSKKSSAEVPAPDALGMAGHLSAAPR
jgi:hypothetical protein